MTKASEIVIISSPRSGTNFFCECLGEYKEVLGLFEIFNPKGVFGANHGNVAIDFAKKADLAAKSALDPDFINYFRSDPSRSLRLMSDVAAEKGYDAFSYKIFPKQLSDTQIEQLMNDPSRRFIFIVRRRLDVFISYEKARQNDVWKNKSTVDLKPEISAIEFLKWAKRNDQWFNSSLEAVRNAGRTYQVLEYGKDINMPKDDVVETIGGVLKNLDLSFLRPNGASRNKFKRQDRNMGPFKKISNGEALRTELRQHMKYNYALSHPLSEHIE